MRSLGTSAQFHYNRHGSISNLMCRWLLASLRFWVLQALRRRLSGNACVSLRMCGLKLSSGSLRTTTGKSRREGVEVAGKNEREHTCTYNCPQCQGAVTSTCKSGRSHRFRAHDGIVVSRYSTYASDWARAPHYTRVQVERLAKRGCPRRQFRNLLRS